MRHSGLEFAKCQRQPWARATRPRLSSQGPSLTVPSAFVRVKSVGSESSPHGESPTGHRAHAGQGLASASSENCDRTVRAASI